MQSKFNYDMLQKMSGLINDIFALITKLVMMVVLWLMPISNYVNMIWVLLLINLVTGIAKAIMQKQKFSTEKVRKSFTKFIMYAIAIIAAFVLQRIMNDGTRIAKYIAVAIGTTELFSIYENISILTGLDIIAIAWKGLKEKIDEYSSGLKIDKQVTVNDEIETDENCS